MDKIKIYSPTQVGVSSFFGGPFAAVYVLWKNFRALGNSAAAKQTLIWGSIFTVLLLVVLPFLPDKFPNLAIPLGYTIAARFIAEKSQMTKQAILQSEQYEFESNWNVAGISTGFLIAMLVVVALWIFALDHFGVI